MSIIPVIISGGSGSRLWPLSREGHPKPFVSLPDGSTLIGKTYVRAANIPNVDTIFTVTNQNHYFLAADCYDATGVNGINNVFLLEGQGRNTAAAIAAATLHAETIRGGQSILLVLPADHLIADPEVLNEAIDRAKALAEQEKIVTFGITPEFAETGYGYIEIDGERVIRFLEKPEMAMAEQFVSSGKHVWNSGMFCFRADVMLAAMKLHCPDILNAVTNTLDASEAQKDPGGTIIRLNKDLFSQSPNVSIDYAVMEKATNIACVATRCGWSDIGSWTALGALFDEDKNSNRTTGEVISVNAHNCIVDAKTRLVGLVGVQDLIVVDTADALLVANKSEAQSVKIVFEELRKSGNEAAFLHQTVHRPWGTYTILGEGESFKIKRLVVKPGQRLSLQAHKHRSEHWVVVSGIATITNGDEKVLLSTNQSTYIPNGRKHRLENAGKLPLIIIEVQSGAYLGEDDI
ncbi:MAG: mannose-1-phosphate guanylyltransferase/mannose-6-phosphate isomerase, partial [Fimbriimonadaceae bacterium]|nr:mannose-1-phosphate guanylyltransferase/mannose-6-phosphate isomerase [Alphaproteobacteria bacterium]